MADLIFPSVNDVNGGVSGQGKTLTEANLRKRAPLPYFDLPYVKSGAAGSNAGGLNLNVALGVYCIEGYYVEKTGTESVLLTASSTNRVWLQLVKDGSGNVTGTSWVVRTDTTVPSGEPSVLTHEVITGASTITTIYDTYRGIVAPGDRIATATPVSSNSGHVAGVDFATLTLMGDGRATYRIQGKAYLGASSATEGSAVVLRDAASGGGSLISTEASGLQSLAGGALMHPIDVDIAPFVGRKTVYAWAFASAGNVQHYGGIVASRLVATVA